MPTSVIGFLGTTLDSGFTDTRWQRWRPTLSLCMQDDLYIDQLHILYGKREQKLLDVLSEDVAVVSPQTQVIGHTFDFRDPWDFADMYAKMYDFANAFPFEKHTDYLIHLTTGTHVAQICWFLLVEAGFLPAHLVQTAPRPRSEKHDPSGRYHIVDLDLSRYDSLRSRFEEEQARNWQTLQAHLITHNRDYQNLIAQIEKVATRSSAPILLMGATGAGKSQLARQIYALKQQKTPTLGKFVEINCATLRGDSAMSVLFGHIKGAFTGAANAREGLLKSADDGVLFLDEIGELGLDEQAMLLTALEEQRFYPLGSDTPVSVSVQLMAGTNKDLRQAVQDGHFRADLFARLNTWMFFLPALKDRLEDLPVNIDYELARIGNQTQRNIRFNSEARSYYEAFATGADALWYGNFRDLSASITRLATLAEDNIINKSDVTAEITRLNTLWQSPPDNVDTPSLRLAQFLSPEVIAELDPFDGAQLDYVISVCQKHPNQAAAGRFLYARSRMKLKNPNDSDRLRKYLLKYGLRFEDLTP